MSDRAMQALQLLVLDPVAETTADRILFEFQRYRSPEDAREYEFRIFVFAVKENMDELFDLFV